MTERGSALTESQNNSTLLSAMPLWSSLRLLGVTLGADGGCGVVWCGVVWCGVVWCGVVWCGVVRFENNGNLRNSVSEV